VPPAATRRRGAVAIGLVLVLGLSWLMRESQHQRVELPGRPSWFTTDPDSQYHLRRVERALADGLPVAEHDAYLNFPAGSPIPWPPYYTLLTYGLLLPFAPDDPGALHAWTETHVASLPLAFGVLTSLVVALAGTQELSVTDFPELLARADILTLHTDYGQQTHHLMDATAFGQIKPGAYLINCAHAGLVDEAALTQAITSGNLAGAALDLLQQEDLRKSMKKLKKRLENFMLLKFQSLT